MFDMFGDGAPMKMAWTAASSTDAFLALPIGGKVHNGRELFGNLTEQTCKGSDKNGYCALAEWDKPENGGNGDGIIDSKDAVFPRLRLWIDSNHDGISQPSELHSLPELGVFSISLHYRESRRTDEFGNTFRFTSRINVTDAEEDQSKDAPITYDVFLLSLPREGMGKASCESKRKQQALNELAF